MSSDVLRGGAQSAGPTGIVADALELEGDALDAYLDQACRDNPGRRAEVESLLAVRDRPGSEDFLEVPALEQIRPGSASGSAPPVPEAVPEQIGPYRILRRLGEGGMGVVYLAEQDQPATRRVALKVIRVLHSERLSRRFEGECKALARLNHPHIAAMYGVGTTSGDERLPFVAMEWIDGLPITRWCDQAGADVQARLEIFLGVCAGVRHAHEKGILHCDLKPGNVLVTRVDGRAIAKVIDFGIARALDGPLVEEGQTTRTLVLGSPSYISPEALSSGGRQNLDARSDVYSLGIMLYELLAGVLPLELEGRGLLHLLQHAGKTDPPAPSSRLARLEPSRVDAIVGARSTSRSRLLRRLRGDLDAIAGKAIGHDPKQRYGSPAELAADLDRHLHHRPLVARSPTAFYLTKCFARRNAGIVSAAALLFVSVVAGFIARSIEADRAQRALAQSEQVQSFMLGLFEGADPEQAIGEALTVRELLDQGIERLPAELPDQPLVRARFLQTIGSIYTKLGDLERAAEVIHQALELRRRHLPPGHAEIVETESEVGVIYRRLGRYDDAESLLLSVLAARQADPEVDAELLARAHSNLGNLYWSRERYQEAETAHRAALALRERNTETLGTAEARIVEGFSANNLGVMLRERGKLSEARLVLRRAVGLLRTENHVILGSALNNLGLVERDLPTWAAAEGLFREALAINESTLGPAHVRPLRNRFNLLVSLSRRHRWQAVSAEGRRVIEYAEQAGDVIFLAKILKTVGRYQLEAGNVDAALSALRRCVERVEAEHGPEHSAALGCRGQLARALAEAGQVEAGVSMIRDIRRRQARSLDADHPARLRTELMCGLILLDAGRFAEAESHFRRHLEGQARNRSERDVTVALSRFRIGKAVAGQGRLVEAVAQLELGLEILQSQLGNMHPFVGDLRHQLGLTEAALGRRRRAHSSLEQAVAIRRAVYPPGDADLEASIEALARLDD